MQRSVAVLVFVLVAGCGAEPPKKSILQVPKKQSSVSPAVESRYLALGDSYTIGESVDKDSRWPMQLAALLRDDGIELGEPTIVARTGWTTSELSQGIDQAEIVGPYELVTLLIGVNNQYRGKSIDEYRIELAELLQRALKFAGDRPERVIVVSIPDWGVTPYAKGRDRTAIGEAIDQFNAVKEEETRKIGATFIEITRESRRAADDNSLLAPDGLHPSGKMYEHWAKAVLPAAKIALRPR
jgi:lysophospholipase L1-like esterase